MSLNLRCTRTVLALVTLAVPCSVAIAQQNSAPADRRQRVPFSTTVLVPTSGGGLRPLRGVDMDIVPVDAGGDVRTLTTGADGGTSTTLVPGRYQVVTRPTYAAGQWWVWDLEVPVEGGGVWLELNPRNVSLLPPDAYAQLNPAPPYIDPDHSLAPVSPTATVPRAPSPGSALPNVRSTDYIAVNPPPPAARQNPATVPLAPAPPPPQSTTVSARLPQADAAPHPATAKTAVSPPTPPDVRMVPPPGPLSSASTPAPAPTATSSVSGASQPAQSAAPTIPAPSAPAADTTALAETARAQNPSVPPAPAAPVEVAALPRAAAAATTMQAGVPASSMLPNTRVEQQMPAGFRRPLSLYDTIVVEPIPVTASADTRDFPAGDDFILQRVLLARLRGSGIFPRVANGATPDALQPPASRAVQLSGSILRYRKGSRAKRAVIGLGVTKVTVRFVLRDAQSGQVLAVLDKEGSGSSGVLTGGDEQQQEAQALLKVVNGVIKDIQRNR